MMYIKIKMSTLYNILYYSTARGDIPVREFLNELPEKVRAKARGFLALLSEEGPNLPRPYADAVRGKIRELRIRFGSDNIRILYYFFLKDNVVLLHALRKQTREIPRGDLALAESRMLDYTERHQKGEIKL